jgi:hypothetical protein
MSNENFFEEKFTHLGNTSISHTTFLHNIFVYFCYEALSTANRENILILIKIYHY